MLYGWRGRFVTDLYSWRRIVLYYWNITYLYFYPLRGRYRRPHPGFL
jgi:hypothetical protein